MAARGLRIDPGQWQDAVAELNETWWCEAEGDDELVVQQALKRREALATYSDEVLAAAWADPDHRVRAAWDPDGSWTGRVTAKGPPLQGITKRGGLRRAVIPAPGCKFVIGDFSQSQLRIVAGLSGDEALRLALEPGRDPHEEIGEAVLPGHPEARAIGKLLNFAILYLAGVDGLVESARDQGISLDRSQLARVRARVRAAYRCVAAWQGEQEGGGEFRSPLGREIVVPPSSRDENGHPELPSLASPGERATLRQMQTSRAMSHNRHYVNYDVLGGWALNFLSTILPGLVNGR